MLVFFSFFITRNVRVCRVRGSRRWLKCTHRGTTVRFFCEISLPFSFVLLGLISFQVYIIFRTPTQSLWSYVPPHVAREHPSFALHGSCGTHAALLLKNTDVLFAVENRHTSCCATHATYAACQKIFLSLSNTLSCSTVIIIIIIIYEFFAPELVDYLSLETEWQQVSLSHQPFFLYSGRS